MGLTGAANAEHGSGSGPVFHAGVDNGIAVCGLTYEEIAYDETELTRYSVDVLVYFDDLVGLVAQLGWSYHETDTPSWGTGPRIGIGFSPPGLHVRVAPVLMAHVHLWLGSLHDEFDIGVEGRLSAQILLKF